MPSAPCRASWGRRTPSYDGTHYHYEGFIVEPSGLPREVEVWVGGRTRRSLRRALELGDAWMPFGMKVDELAGLLTDTQTLEGLARYADEHGRPLKLHLAPEPPIDPLGQPEETAEFLGHYVALGATGFSLRFDHHSAAHFAEQMAATKSVIETAGL